MEEQTAKKSEKKEKLNTYQVADRIGKIGRKCIKPVVCVLSGAVAERIIGKILKK